MIRIVTIATAAALMFTGAAQAKSIVVPVSGKSPAEVHKAIRLAAQNVCADAMSPSPLSFYIVSDCLRDAIANAEAQLAKSVASTATVHGQDASTVASR